MDTNPDDMSIEALRARAFASAAANLLQLSQNSQKEALEYITQNVAQLEQFFGVLNDPNHALSRTLFLGIAATLLSSHIAPSFEEAKGSLQTPQDMLQKLTAYNFETTPKSTYDILRTYFPDGNSDTPQIYPNFTPDNVEQAYGAIGINLYNWLDATFSLLQSKYDD